MRFKRTKSGMASKPKAKYRISDREMWVAQNAKRVWKSRPFCKNTGGRSRICNLLIRSQVLYPIELRPRNGLRIRRLWAIGKWHSERSAQQTTEGGLCWPVD